MNNLDYTNPLTKTCYAQLVTDLGGALPALATGVRAYFQNWQQNVRITNTDNTALVIAVYYIKCKVDCSENPLNAAGDFNTDTNLFPNYAAGNYLYYYDSSKRKAASRPVPGAFEQPGFNKNFMIYGKKTKVLQAGETLYVNQKLTPWQKVVYQRYHDPAIDIPRGTKFMVIRWFSTGLSHSVGAAVSGTNLSGAPGGRIAVHTTLTGKIWVPPSLPQETTWVFNDSTDRYLDSSYSNMKAVTEVAEQAILA